MWPCVDSEVGRGAAGAQPFHCRHGGHGGRVPVQNVRICSEGTGVHAQGAALENAAALADELGIVIRPVAADIF